jgi:sterol desaturase/sphingolipid hydroxylase (fatty acid hydroxylase superfamily)
MVSGYFTKFVPGTGIFLWLAIMLVGLAIERLHPVEKGQPRSNIVLNLHYSIVHFWAIFAETPIAATASAFAVGALGGGVIVLPGAGWGLLWAIPLYVLAMDLAEYLFHRAQHAWPFLWAMHSLHHSDTALNITTTARHFWIEMAIKLLFVYPFVSLLLSPSPVVLVAYAIASYWNFVAHMNIRASFGRCWPMLNSPQYHRIHHAADLVYANRNFAALFPVYDVIFGTYHRPEKDEYPASGLGNGESPSDLLDVIAWPLRRYLRIRPVLDTPDEGFKSK